MTVICVAYYFLFVTCYLKVSSCVFFIHIFLNLDNICVYHKRISISCQRLKYIIESYEFVIDILMDTICRPAQTLTTNGHIFLVTE